MKTHIQTTILSALALTGSLQAFSGGGVNAASETTQLSNKIQLVAQLSKQSEQFKTQLDQYQSQIRQLNLEEIASKILDTSSFNDTMVQLNQYAGAFNVSDSKARIDSLKTIADFKNGGVITNETFIENLSKASNKKIELEQNKSALTELKMASIQDDQIALKALQSANAGAEGSMQAAQVGNHINTEVAAQILKMRKEQADLAQIETEKSALEAEDEALHQAWKEQMRVKREKDLQEILDTPPRRLGF